MDKTNKIMKYYQLIFLCLLAFSSCKQKQQTEENISEEFTNEVVETEGVKLYTLDGGTVIANKLEIFAQGDLYQGESKTFADAFYVIEHPKGKLLWDAGLAEGLVGQEPFTTPDGMFTVSRNDSVVSQLAKINMVPSDFDYIALSHTHFDHTGSASKFSDATWLVQETEYNFITSEEQKKGDNYPAIANLTKVKTLNGDYDVFGDGTVVIKSTPGHTPGHQSLFLRLKNAGPILLTGDLYHFKENRTNKGVPIFNFNVEQTLNSMELFEEFAKETNARVIIQHNREDFNTLASYPKYTD